MTSNSPSPASHVDIPTTDSTPVAYIGGLYESHSEVVQGLLREFVNGLIDVHPLPNDPGTREVTAHDQDTDIFIVRLEFSDVACAQRAIAVLNRHPALQGEGPYYCSPEPAEHPRPDVPFTARILRAQRCIVPSSDRHRPRWMDDREDAMCNPAPWPDDFPTPEDVYDACIALGPIFSVEIWPFKSVNGSPWSARVQFYTPEDAAALETQLRGSLLCGWEV